MMRPVLEISTTPARYEYQVMRARLEVTQEKPKVDRKVSRATINMQKQAGRFEMNTVRRRSDMGFKGVVDWANSDGERGRKQALETTGNYAEMGNQVAQFHKGGNFADAIWSQAMKQNQGDLVLLPVSPIDIQYIPASLAADYQPGEMQADWDVGRARMDFVPGSFNLDFIQYASVNFEYVGGFNYVPAAADPNYVAEA